MERYLNNKTGDIIETEMEEEVALERLPKNSDFAQSLKKQYKEKNGNLSEIQLYWIMKLALEVDELHPCDTAEIMKMFSAGKIKIKVEDETVLIYPNGVVFYNGKRFGKYTTQGFVCQGNADLDTAKRFVKLAAGTAAKLDKLGKITGVCCYCGIKLTHEISIGLGRGPICSEKRGLPFPFDEYNKSLK